MPRQTKIEHEAALANARAEGALQAVQLARTLAEQGLDLDIALGALDGLSKQLANKAAALTAESLAPAAQRGD